MTTEKFEEKFEEWCVLELMGRRRLAGRVSDAAIGGGAFLRIDIPGANGEITSTQFYSPQSVYCITPTTEAIARKVAIQYAPEPVHKWELNAIDAPRDAKQSAFCGIDDGDEDD